MAFGTLQSANRNFRMTVYSPGCVKTSVTNTVAGCCPGDAPGYRLCEQPQKYPDSSFTQGG